jgi:hypothetical protein
MMTEEERRQAEERLERALDDRMPAELDRLVSKYIVPATMNAGLKHGEVMGVIFVAWPEIRDWVRDHPEVLA